jgi:hypothetical protein
MKVKTMQETVTARVLEVTHDEVLLEFAKIMGEWGHYRAGDLCQPLRLPGAKEIEGTAAARQERRLRELT